MLIPHKCGSFHNGQNVSQNVQCAFSETCLRTGPLAIPGGQKSMALSAESFDFHVYLCESLVGHLEWAQQCLESVCAIIIDCLFLKNYPLDSQGRRAVPG